MLGALKAMQRWALWLRIAVAAGALAVVFLFQIPLDTEVPGEPFLLFFLVVMATTVAFGPGVGLFGVALSTFLAAFFFSPGNSLALTQASDLIEIELYAILAAGAVVGLGRLGKALLAADQAAQALAQSEQAKSVLLRELAHRAANNFAAVASLIRRKANLVDDGDAKSVLNEAVEQVMVLARIHNRLHAEHSDMMLDSRSFLNELCDDLKVLIMPGHRLTIECTAISCRLSMAQAIPFGLIVNELVTNAIKHAFPDGRPGTVSVSLHEAAEHLSLSVRDDGVGLDACRTRDAGMGQELVRALAQQLGGELQVKSTSGGSKFRVVFPRAGADTQPASASRTGSMLH